MKTITPLFLILFNFLLLNAQEFSWAWSYPVPNCNEVASLAVDDTGNIYSVGVFNAPNTLPYTGTAYFQKIDPEGQVIWTEYMDGLLQISDMGITGNSPVIIGQSSAPFSYKGGNYGLDTFYMFIIKTDPTGEVEWILTDPQKWGLNTNISVDVSGNMAFHIRGQSNLGDHIWVLDPDGTVLQTKTIATNMTTIVDLAYFNSKVYLSGGLTGASGLVVDTIFIPQSSFQKTTFVLALNENLTAEWVATDTSINNTDGRVVANSAGVFVYEGTINSGFITANVIKKFDFEGQVLKKINAPVFSTGTLRPDLVVNDSVVALFVKNNNNSTSQKAAILKHDLSIMAEKVITGPSNFYSGQIATNGNDLFIANIHTGELDFDGELTLPVNDLTKKLFIAKIMMPAITTGLAEQYEAPVQVGLFPNPAKGDIFVEVAGSHAEVNLLFIFNSQGVLVPKSYPMDTHFTLNTSHLPAGIYHLRGTFRNGGQFQKSFVKQ
jgi:hypothetical protein